MVSINKYTLTSKIISSVFGTSSQCCLQVGMYILKCINYMFFSFLVVFLEALHQVTVFHSVPPQLFGPAHN